MIVYIMIIDITKRLLHNDDQWSKLLARTTSIKSLSYYNRKITNYLFRFVCESS